MNNLTPGADEYLVERLNMGFDSGESTTLHIWRQSLGKALENWNLGLVRLLIMELCRHDQDILCQAHLRMGRGGLLAKQHYWDDALEEMNKANDLFAKTDDYLGRCWTLLSLGNLYDDFGDWEKAEKVYQEAISLYKKTGDQYGEAQALVNLGTAFYNQSNWSDATNAFRKSLDVFIEVNDIASAAMSLSGLGHILTELGEYEQAIECYEASLEIFTEQKNITGVVSTLNNLGRVYDSSGKIDRAIEMYQQSLEKAANQGDLRSQATALDNLGVSLSSIKRYTESQTAHERSLAIFSELGDRLSVSASLNHLGLIYTKTNKYDLAESNFIESIRLKRELEDQRGLVSVLINFAEMHLAQQHWNEMKDLCNEALKVIGDQPFHEPQAIATFLIGVCHCENGLFEIATKQFARSIVIAWNFNPILGERIDRAIVRQIKALKQLGKLQDEPDFVNGLMINIQRLTTDQDFSAIKHISSLLEKNSL